MQSIFISSLTLIRSQNKEEKDQDNEELKESEIDDTVVEDIPWTLKEVRVVIFPDTWYEFNQAWKDPQKDKHEKDWSDPETEAEII